MGWFDEQIKLRKDNEKRLYEESFSDIAGAVLGAKGVANLRDDNRIARDALDEILKYYRAGMEDIPESLVTLDDQLDYILRPHGIMRRDIVLTEGWYKDSIGAILSSRTDDGSIVALIPDGYSGYSFFDKNTGKRVRVNSKTAKLISEEAIAFYKPFPLRKMTLTDVGKFVFSVISKWDYLFVALSALAVVVLGMITPYSNKLLFGTVIGNGDTSALLSISVFLVNMTIGSLFFMIIKTLIVGRIQSKVDFSVSAATMMRILSLHPRFFTKYSSGELSNYQAQITGLCQTVLNLVITTGLSSAFSLVYIGQIFTYAPSLAVPAIVVILVTIGVSTAYTIGEMKIVMKRLKLVSKENGLSYELISGVQKIKLAGAERRAFAKWAKKYSQVAEATYNPPVILKLNSAIVLAVSSVGTIVIYYSAVRSGISVADYYAFNSAYGLVSGAFMALANIAVQIAQIKPVLELVKPIFDAEPEDYEGNEVVTRISGSVELSHVSFRYNEDMPLVYEDLSLKIKSGQYVAIVGKTGCGKSTIVRLLLGFEKPEKGAIYYDGKDISTLDIKSLRKNIGVVMQNTKLFSGDIFSNITISNPQLTVDDAWEAARIAGIEDYIKGLPMGMYTYISEGGGGISGGQRQRIAIARAVATKPKLLILDEATSALDNITQKAVSDALDSLKCTRIVIAHRLSTIKNCDRIIVMDGGKIIEDGKYDELIAQNGFFAELVSRQRIEEN